MHKGRQNHNMKNIVKIRFREKREKQNVQREIKREGIDERKNQKSN